MESYLSSFTTLIQLAATLNLACVAVSRFGLFRNILLQDVFKIDEIKTFYFEPVHSKVVGDIESLKAMDPVDIGDGKTTQATIDSLKTDYELLDKKCAIAVKDIENDIPTKYCPRCMDQSFLYLSLYSVCSLFLIAFHNTCGFLVFCSRTFNLLSSLFLIVIIINEFKSNIPSILMITRYRHVVKVFIFTIIASISMAFLNDLFGSYMQIKWSSLVVDMLAILTVCVPFSGFILYYMKIRSLSHKITKTIFEKSRELDALQVKFHVDKEKLNTTHETIMNIKNQVAHP